ncbi:hypothetical protein N9R79_07955 [Vibrio sp.]|nr:hypothetical protein [Vibrio sp.]
MKKLIVLSIIAALTGCNNSSDEGNVEMPHKDTPPIEQPTTPIEPSQPVDVIIEPIDVIINPIEEEINIDFGMIPDNGDNVVDVIIAPITNEPIHQYPDAPIEKFPVLIGDGQHSERKSQREQRREERSTPCTDCGELEKPMPIFDDEDKWKVEPIEEPITIEPIDVIVEPIEEPITVEPIDVIVDPIEGEPAVRPIESSNVVGGEVIGYDINGTYILGQGNRQSKDGNPIWVYPEYQFGETTLSQIAIEELYVDLQGNLVTSGVYVSIYLDGYNYDLAYSYFVESGVVQPHPKSTKLESFASYNDFLTEYGDSIVQGISEGMKLRTNFIIRIGDSNDDMDNAEVQVRYSIK